MSNRGNHQIILAGKIGINHRDDNISWEGYLGQIHLSNLCWYLGERLPTSLPEEIHITSHVSGDVLIFRHSPFNSNPAYELYEAELKSQRILLYVLVRPTELERLRSSALNAKKNKRECIFS